MILLAFTTGCLLVVYMNHEALSYSRTFVGAGGDAGNHATPMASMSGSLLVAFGLPGRRGGFRTSDTHTSYILWVMEGLRGTTPVFHGGHLSSRYAWHSWCYGR
jgi:hypothetical protein